MNTVNRVEKDQAQTFFKVLLKKGHDVSQIANVLSHMGQMLVLYAEDLDEHPAPSSQVSYGGEVKH